MSFSSSSLCTFVALLLLQITSTKTLLAFTDVLRPSFVVSVFTDIPDTIATDAAFNVTNIDDLLFSLTKCIALCYFRRSSVFYLFSCVYSTRVQNAQNDEFAVSLIVLCTRIV